MPHAIRLVLCLHNHQPVGNFDGVFEAAYQDSYKPFLDVLLDYPEIPIVLHNSGSLLEWIVEHHPEYIDRVRALVARGQVEILGGPFFEPILAAIPRRDRIGQIRAYTHFLERTFAARVRGAWVPERVWEQSFAGDLADGGIEYTMLDDSHFRGTGLADDQLHGYHFTEDEGKLLKIFPDSERLRYAIPFEKPEAATEYLRGIAERMHNAVVVFGDDGEKFGVWPGTKDHVYGDGWLRKFFDLLRQEKSWLKVCTLAQAVDQVPPLTRVYLPDSSYREMTEWALPTQEQLDYQSMMKNLQTDAEQFAKTKRFIRAGFWRNFLVKYPESNEMYCRMREVSQRVEQLSRTEEAKKRPDLIAAARTELYRGQCNCPYWHGAFGGLYLPHLRNAIYQHLIAADTALEELAGRTGRWATVEADDYNLDARKEVRMASDRLVAYIASARGGHLYELDVRATKTNLLATLNRRPEPYHQKILAGARATEYGETVALHEQVKFKQPDLDKKLQYDTWPRKSLVDHFLAPTADGVSFQAGQAGIGDFVTGVYETRLRRSDRRVETILTREGRAGQHLVRVTKSIVLNADVGGVLEIHYELSQLPIGPEHTPLRFGVEFNFATLPAEADDRFYYDAHGRQLGQLQTIHDLDAAERIGLVDEWQGLDISLDFSRAAGVWTFPIQTVSQSEGGFELVHQSCAVIPHWEIVPDDQGRWSVDLRLSIDTSAAQARQLVEAGAERHAPREAAVVR